MSQNPLPYTLGRIAVADDRDKLFPLRSITNVNATPRTVPWQLGPLLNQGQNPWCVAFTGREWMDAEPYPVANLAEPSPAQLYAGAQANDEIAGPHDGSTDRGLMKYLTGLSLVGPFHWAQTIEEAAQYVLTTGTVMCGVPWHRSMFTPDSEGYLHPDGDVVGGHEFLGSWYIEQADDYVFRNSWGNWGNVPGQPGMFKMHAADFRALLASGGDVCAAQKVLVPNPLVPAPQPPRHKSWRWSPWGGWRFSITRKDDAE